MIRFHSELTVSEGDIYGEQVQWQADSVGCLLAKEYHVTPGRSDLCCSLPYNRMTFSY